MVKSIFLKATKIVLACIFLFSSTGFTYALNESIEDFFAQNGFIYYNPDGNNGNGSDCYDLNGSATNAKVTIIGDSITEGAETYVKNKFGDRIQGKVYAKISKFWKKDTNDNPSGMTILDELINKNELAPVVIFALGTNGGASKEDVYETIQKIGTDKYIIFMTVHPDQKGNKDANTNGTFNDIIINIANSEPNVSYFDWAATVAGKKVTLTDNVHPDSKGSKVFADLMFQAYNSISGGAPATVSAEANKFFYKEDDGRITMHDIFSKKELQTVQRFKEFYQKAAEERGIPWQMIAAIHKKETGLSKKFNSAGDKKNSGKSNGPFCIIRIGREGINDRGKFTLPIDGWPYSEEEMTDEDFQQQVRYAADILKVHMVTSEKNGLSGDDAVKYAFHHYNSGNRRDYIAQGENLQRKYSELKNINPSAGDGSVYVMNGADKIRAANQESLDWQIQTSSGHLEKGKHVVPGVFLMYRALGGGSGSYSGDCIQGGSNGAVAGDINATAIAFSANAPNQYLPGGIRTDAYVEANKKYFSDRDHRHDGADCSAFVSTVLAASGFDPDIVKKGNTTAAMGPYLSSHPEKYENITDLTGDGRTNNLSPGDIIIKVEGFNGATHGHVELIVEVNGELKMASASIPSGKYPARFPDHVSPIYSKLNESKQWRVFRPIAK